MPAFTIKLSKSEHAAVLAAARNDGLSIGEWMQGVLSQAVVGDAKLLAVVDVLTMARFGVATSPELVQARAWLALEFAPADVKIWLEAGCSRAEFAKAARDAGICPEELELVWKESFERAGTALTIGVGLSRGLLEVEELPAAVRAAKSSS